MFTKEAIQVMRNHCDRLGIVWDTNKRWEQGIEHHRRAIDVFSDIENSDWYFGDDSFGWKSGGDGDNGENLLYSLSVWYELNDALKLEHDKQISSELDE